MPIVAKIIHKNMNYTFLILKCVFISHSLNFKMKKCLNIHYINVFQIALYFESIALKSFDCNINRIITLLWKGYD